MRRIDLPWKWSLFAALAGFGASFVLADRLRWPRPAFVIGWSLAGFGLCLAYILVERVRPRIQLSRQWRTGTFVGFLIGVILLLQVFSQPGSGRSSGTTLLGDLALYGVVYGLVDALLLSVIPVLTLYGSQPPEVLLAPGGRVRWGGIALLVSALVTAAYHLGFPEFRGPALVEPVIGNLIMTVGYLLTGSPIAALLSHVMMHSGAVLHGMENTVQLPPHY